MVLTKKVIIITGASSGIGLATAKLFSQKGARLALVARSLHKLKKLAATLPDSIAIKTDMTKPVEIRSMVKSVIPYLRKQGGGAIVNISSGTTLMNLPTMSPYASIKTALNALSLTAREELKQDKITDSLVYPYITATNFEKNTFSWPENRQWKDDGRNRPPADPPEHIARKILETVETGKPEIFAHEWMGKKRV